MSQGDNPKHGQERKQQNTGAEPVHNSDAYLLFNKQTDQALIDAVNTALEELKADGTIKELSEEYLDGDYVPE